MSTGDNRRPDVGRPFVDYRVDVRGPDRPVDARFGADIAGATRALRTTRGENDRRLTRRDSGSGLTGDVEDPARHRGGGSVFGQLADERGARGP
jgi:hypothetical protein